MSANGRAEPHRRSHNYEQLSEEPGETCFQRKSGAYGVPVFASTGTPYCIRDFYQSNERIDWVYMVLVPYRTVVP